jgi:acyl-CoA reductase-like NAD-dependent aldehyde dehydrogenase
MLQIKNYINGKLLPPKSGEYFHNSSPVDGQVYSQVPDSYTSDINNAVSAAKDAFKTWSKLTKKERHEHIMRLADEIDNHFLCFLLSIF